MSDDQLKRQLRNLAAAQTPLGTLSDPEASDADFLEKITVGDAFVAQRDDAIKAMRALPTEQDILKLMFVGTFGSGKTHMALSLYHALKQDADQLIVTFDFSKLNGDSEMFQYLLVTGLRWQGHYGYQSVCRALFERIAEQLGVDAEQQAVNVVKASLYGIYEHLTESAEGITGVIGNVFNRGLGDEIKDSLRNGTLSELIERYRNQTSHEFIAFIEALADLAANPDAYSGKFEDVVRELSANAHGGFQLTDYLFKLFKFAGFERLLIMGDEFEALSAYGDAFVEHVLATLRDFHDECVAQAARQNYPAIALIFFSTDPFLLDTVQFSDSGLWRRWENHIVELAEPEVEDVIEPMVEIAQESNFVTLEVDLPKLINAILQDRDRLRQQSRPYVMSNLLARLFSELRKYQR